LKKAISPKMLLSAKKFFEQTSVVKEAIEAYKTGGVNAMHDPTEGGIVGGVYEMAEASNLGVKILEEKILVEPETAEICKFFKINPLHLISSGALLIAAKPKTTDTIIENLKAKNIPATIIGEFLEDSNNRILIKRSGKADILPKPAPDHLWAALNKR
jgi:hydrogenase expression/formation protein HypE